jgi:hypothetical protein
MAILLSPFFLLNYSQAADQVTPSRPRFASVGVNVQAPTTNGDIRANRMALGIAHTGPAGTLIMAGDLRVRSGQIDMVATTANQNNYISMGDGYTSFLGSVGAANGIIQGSAAGDVAWSNNGNILFSTDWGDTIAAKLDTDDGLNVRGGFYTQGDAVVPGVVGKSAYLSFASNTAVMGCYDFLLLTANCDVYLEGRYAGIESYGVDGVEFITNSTGTAKFFIGGFVTGQPDLEVSDSGIAIRNSTSPLITFNDPDGSSNAKLYEIRGNEGGIFEINTLTDAGGTGATALQINRNGTTVDSIALTATSVTVNSSEVCTENGTNCPTAGAPRFAVVALNGAGGCSVSASYSANFTTSSCTNTGTGVYLLTFSTTFADEPICTANLLTDNDPVIVQISPTSATAVNIIAKNSSFSNTDTSGNITFICVGE